MSQLKLRGIFFLSAFLLPLFFNSFALAETPRKNKKYQPSGNQLSETKDRRLTHYAFPLPDTLKPNYEFWKLIYSQYDKNQVVFHDTENLQIIYSVLDFTELANQYPPESREFSLEKNRKMKAEKERIHLVLKKLNAEKGDFKNLSEEENKIYHLFDSMKEPTKFSAALKAGRLRSQTGQKDKFIKAIEYSGAHLAEIENIFNSYGLPVELTRLIFVESMFNIKARSKVGASGIWQFMPQTGRLFMTVSSIIDERNDPILSSHAAAHLLKMNYEELQSWPLAVNAYNSGIQSIAQAKTKLRTEDIGVIANQYQSRTYQFASRNFYAEFLAALEVANHYKNYFGEIKRLPPFQYDTFTLETALPLHPLAENAGVDIDLLEEMNLAYHPTFFSSNRTFPLNRTIKIPLGTKPQFQRGIENIALKQIGKASHKVSESGYPKKKKFVKLGTPKRKLSSVRKESGYEKEMGELNELN